MTLRQRIEVFLGFGGIVFMVVGFVIWDWMAFRIGLVMFVIGILMAMAGPSRPDNK